MKNHVAKFKPLKYTASSLMIALLLILALASPVLAFDPPTQDTTANATDVILWGDNVTLTLEVPDGLEVSGELEVTGVDDFLTNLFAFIIMAGITAFVVLSKSIFGKSITSVLLITYGLRMAIPEDTWSVLWMAGVVIALIGTSLIFKVIWEAVKSTVTKLLRSREE